MASSVPEIARLLDNNAEFVKTYTTPPTMDQIRSSASGNPNAGATVILTCLDPRVIPEQFFGPQLNNGVIRNAGGHATTDAITSMTVLRSLANLKNVVVVHHSDCGMTHLTQEQIVKEAVARTPKAKEWIQAQEYGSFTGEKLEESVRADVGVLRGAEVLEGVSVWGMVLETTTGVVRALDG